LIVLSLETRKSSIICTGKKYTNRIAGKVLTPKNDQAANLCLQVTMYSSPGKTKELGFALDIALQSLEFYANLFKIPFPLPKMDIVGIPDFEAGKTAVFSAPAITRQL